MPVVVRGEPVTKNEAGVWGPELPEELIFISGNSFQAIEYGGFNTAGRVSTGARFGAGVPGENLAYANARAPKHWSGKRFDVIFGISAGGLVPIGNFRLIARCNATSPGAQELFTVTENEISAEDNNATDMEVFTALTAESVFGGNGYPEIGLVFGREADHVEDTSGQGLNLEWAMLRLHGT